VTGALREHLAKLDPSTAAANAEYSLYKTATDVMDATAEIERVRPKVGRQLIARLTGATVGGQAAGAAGAVGGFILGPVLDSVMSSGATTKLQTAQLMSKLAKAIRAGDQGYVNSLSLQLQSLAKRASVANQVGRTTSPSESQTGGAPALLPQQ
jgi:tetrahydromethanopterin S-methyltransferase subunit F